MSNMPCEISKPMISVAEVVANKIAKSPVPVAISKIVEGFLTATILRIFCFHFASVPKEMILFNPS